MRFRLFVAALVTLVVQGRIAAAQGDANLDVTVIPSYSAGQSPPPRDGFLVCAGTMSDFDAYGSQLTPANGVANQAFRNLPVGQQVVVRVSKTGWGAAQQIVTLQSGWVNHLQFHPQPNAAGANCPSASAPVSTAPPASPPPAPAPPAPSSSTPTRMPIQSVSFLPTLSVSSFLIGGAENPARVRAGVRVPLVVSYATSALAPTHYRVSERAEDMNGTGNWKPVSEAPAFSFSTAGRHTLYYQAANRSGTLAPNRVSNVATDVVEVVAFSTSSVRPDPVGRPSTERHRLECGNGAFVKSVFVRQGLLLDALGIECPGNRKIGPFGGSGGEEITIWTASDCPVTSHPASVPITRIPTADVLRYMKSSFGGDFVCYMIPDYGIAPTKAVAAPGLSCPTQSLPVALDVYLEKAPITGAKFVVGVGMICMARG